MLKRLFSHPRSWAILLAVPLMLGFSGCTGGGTSTATNALSTIVNNAKKSTVFVEVTNSTSNNITLTIAVDGVSKTLPACTALQQTCNYALSTCPSKVELLEEIELNTAGQFVSGRNFQGSAGYTFTSGQFTCGGQIIYSFGDNQVNAMAF